YPSQLSGGQKQRVAIVRALAMNPEVLLFDEPTSALDPEMVGEVENLMRELAKDGMTMLVVSHDTDFAMELADRIVFLADGKVVVDAPPSVISASDNSRIRDFFSLR
ncbi:MAG: ATP-binding cassette domain-containing protein, partial [Akkermansia sp.]|nr:ATP-binding cassette domain-containing protein [Akkermansia sp.]